MTKTKAWIEAFRLRTLPLSVSGIIVGSALAAILDKWDISIFILAITTTIGFQVLSNLANDLGDSQKGTDNQNRVGPMRSVQSGAISQSEMKVGMGICALLSLLSAGALIYVSSHNLTKELLIFYGVLALLCILAAITYTVGKNAYGYRGLGDLMVFLFFGMVSVLGVFSLYGLTFEWLVLFPAISIGLWSTAVLNLNNLRDHVNDKSSGKNTMVVKLGYKGGKNYHAFLIIGGFATWFFTVLSLAYLTFNYFLFIAIMPSILLLFHLQKVFATEEPTNLDPELKKVALLTFFSAVLFAVISNLFLH
ncbi:MAG: 1,4-dihydroxy-2-naphthoate octaprenyltransferase [Flavobacteriales bacterium]|nr:1,4-dihydroxy-2-naphthoate octaprenyltransferase [Flavobacteriales bacterium]